MRASLLALLGWLLAGPAVADDPCAGARKEGRLASVGPALTLALDDGTRLALADVALAAWPRGLLEASALTVEALAPLIGRGVAYRAFGTEDALGQRAAHVWLRAEAGGGDDLWIQDDLVARGLVRVAPERAQSCAPRLLTREAAARGARRGIWREDRFADAHAPDALRNATGTYQLVSGRVAAVARTRSGTYVNFGDVWRFDTTALITPALADRIAEALPDAGGDAASEGPKADGAETDGLKALEGEIVLVRGWIEDKNGPLIRIRSAHQLRRIDE